MSCKYCDKRLKILYFYRKYGVLTYVVYPRQTKTNPRICTRNRKAIHNVLKWEDLDLDTQEIEFTKKLEDLQLLYGKNFSFDITDVLPKRMSKVSRNRLPNKPRRQSTRIEKHKDTPNYADPIWFNNRAFGNKRKPPMSNHEKTIQKRIKEHDTAEKEIKDFEFQIKLKEVEFIEVSSRSQDDKLPDCSGGMTEDHWVGYTFDGEEEILHEDYLYKALSADQTEMLFPQENVTYWKTKKNQKHELSDEIKKRIIDVGNSLEKTPSCLVTKIMYCNNDHTWKGLLGDNNKVINLPEFWMRRNVKQIDATFYDKYCKGNGKVTTWTNLPIGSGVETNTILSTSGEKLFYEERDGCSTCVIVNILNTLYLLDDTETHKKMNWLENDETWLKMVHEINISPTKYPHVMCGLQVLRKHKYQVKKVKIPSVLEYVFKHPTLCVVSNVHCIVIWNDKIIDSNHSHTLELTMEHLNWCCGDFKKFSRIFLAYEFQPSQKLAKRIGYNENVM